MRCTVLTKQLKRYNTLVRVTQWTRSAEAVVSESNLALSGFAIAVVVKCCQCATLMLPAVVHSTPLRQPRITHHNC